MSNKFEIVLYCKKRITIGGKPSIDTMIKAKRKLEPDLGIEGYDAILDAYSEDKSDVGREEIIDTWVMILEDENFAENLLKIENDESFIDWSDESKELIKTLFRE